MLSIPEGDELLVFTQAAMGKTQNFFPLGTSNEAANVNGINYHFDTQIKACTNEDPESNFQGFGL